MKNSKNKAAFICILFMVVCLIGGFFCGRFTYRLIENNSLGSLKENLSDILYRCAFPTFFAFSALSVIIGLALYFSCCKTYRQLQKDNENDELWDKLEEKLDKPMIVSELSLIIIYFFMISAFYVVICTDTYTDDNIKKILFIAGIIVFVVFMFINLFIQFKAIGIEKKLNPEKTANIIDLKFISKWVSQCDEAERLIMYKSAFGAIRITNLVCTIMIIAAIIAAFLFNTGIFPLFCVTVIFAVLNLSYMINGDKAQKKK